MRVKEVWVLKKLSLPQKVFIIFTRTSNKRCHSLCRLFQQSHHRRNIGQLFWQRSVIVRRANICASTQQHSHQLLPIVQSRVMQRCQTCQISLLQISTLKERSNNEREKTKQNKTCVEQFQNQLRVSSIASPQQTRHSFFVLQQQHVC
jgi:hypothetical protein